ncbi:hypothetical protein RND81_10G041100 [Saponaria officinalis]|uniref:ribonuclease P n=1 Tax=Saponaria officinalis TaxID=3572 RepID=A0AAW1HYU8_SAPOF
MTKKKKNNPESQLHYELGTCSEQNDLKKAISLYESAITQNLKLSAQHFNSILHLCSTPETLTCEDTKSLALEYGFRVYNDMLARKIPPTEATITQISRLSAAKNDPDYGFGLIKEMGGLGLVPRLRTYGPTLCCFCDNLRVNYAYEVEKHMISNGVKLEEGEIFALLRVSCEVGTSEKVYEYLHKLRGAVRGVSEEGAKVVERWFRGEKAAEVGVEECDVGRARDEKDKNGGGWHGLGWFGKGCWVVKRVRVREDGRCCGCKERLVCVDIDCGETERFRDSVASLALERESKSNFKSFMEWIEKHSDYEAIVDAANIGLYQQNFADGGFSIMQLEAIVRGLYNRNKKWPLVVLHNKRLRALQGNPSCRKLFDEWLAQGILYATPRGSNDDWYWLYAAVKLKCLLVTNDEMRDHVFELLGSSFFLQWKERHQVHYTFSKGAPVLKMLPTYSILIQESENGSWHVPVANASSDELSRTWLCITRPSLCNSVLQSCCNNTGHESHPHTVNGTVSLTGKRKERDLSPSRL